MRIKVVLEIAAAASLAFAASCGELRPRAEVSDGERLYNARCTGCHRAYEPAQKTPAQWQAAVAKMERWKKVSLSAGDRALILGYLTGATAAPVAAPGAPATADLAAPPASAPQALLRP